MVRLYRVLFIEENKRGVTVLYIYNKVSDNKEKTKAKVNNNRTKKWINNHTKKKLILFPDY